MDFVPRKLTGRGIELNVVFSVIAISLMAVSVGYNVGFGQTYETAGANSRVVNVHADKLKPLLDALSNDIALESHKTTHLRVDPPQQRAVEETNLSTPASSFDVTRLQEDLMLRGTFEGPVSSRFDNATQMAVRKYQRGRGLPTTGEVNQTLLDALAFDRQIDSAVGFTGSLTPPNNTLKIRRVQSALDRMGYDPGPVDGAMGLKTTAAIKRFQRSRGRNATGLIDDELLAAMGIAPQSARQE